MRISVRAPWALYCPCSAVSPIIVTQWRQTYHSSFQARSSSSGKHHITFPSLLLFISLNISQLRPKIFAQRFFSRLSSVWISNCKNYSISFLGVMLSLEYVQLEPNHFTWSCLRESWFTGYMCYRITLAEKTTFGSVSCHKFSPFARLSSYFSLFAVTQN